MTSGESLGSEAIAYVKAREKELIKHFIGNSVPVAQPVSIFMAGSPGAGKTEFSTRLLEGILGAKNSIVRIDPDEIRIWLPQYIPGNAHFFQGAVSLGVNKIIDYVKSNSISFLLDGTFSKQEQAFRNIQLSLDKKRAVLIQYVLQPPEVAWRFTQEREQVDGRNILREDFITEFLAARDTVAAAKEHFGDNIQIDLIERNKDTNRYETTFNVDNLDKYLPRKYSKDDIESLI